MNPFDPVGTGRISPALHDRTCRVAMGYQDLATETAVVAGEAGGPQRLLDRAVATVRASRGHPDLRSGSSVRGAIDLVLVARQLAQVRDVDAEGAGLDAALAALTGRVVVLEGSPRTPEDVVTELWEASAPQEAAPGKA